MELYLESVTDPSRRLYIAYSRGNEVLTNTRGQECGGKLLYGGPAFTSDGQNRTQFLRTRRGTEPYSLSTHTYSIVWTRGQIELSVDGRYYGEVTNHHFADKTRLVLGVGVGGLNDFPEGYKSNGVDKPWTNGDVRQIKDFLEAYDSWSPTWVGDDVALQIDSIKIWAV